MKNLKVLSKKANELRKNFQNQIVNPYIEEHGSLKGYKGQIYILLPNYDGRIKLYKSVDYSVYSELYNYLFHNQSQRRFNNSYKQINQLEIYRSFGMSNLKHAFNRVWHNGCSVYGDSEHWKAQSKALFNKIDKFGFRFYENDYNFPNYHYDSMQKANPTLVNLYEKKIENLLSE